MITGKKIIFAGLYTIGMHLLTALKLSFILGSKMAWFSLNQCLTPVMGFFAGVPESLLVFALRSGIAIFFKGLSFYAFIYHLPTFCGTLYLATGNRIIRLGIPLACAIFFIEHPVGAASTSITLYWILPILMSFKMPRSIFLRALASTLTTHAVGSTLWLYTHPTNPAFWHALHSVIWLERLLFAACMTAAYYAVVYVHSKIRRTSDYLGAA